MSDQNNEMRAAAVKRINAKRNFWRMLGVFVILAILLTVIWALTGGGYFWPAWAFLGLGVAAAFTAWGAYGPVQAPPSDEQVNDEMRKMGGD